tara:strand:+ start:181 stop:1416 length:1236 start_codon:yes stop_codon:yes gene_type:complete
MDVLDLCAGIGSFSLAAKQVNGGTYYNTVACSEVENFCNKVLSKQGHEIIGDLRYIGLPESKQKYSDLLEMDLVPAEETGFTSISLEDILEGVVDIKMCMAGSPCQDISSANTEESGGIDGSKSSVIHDIMEKVELIEPDFVLLENSSALIRKGLHVLLSVFHDLGYIVEWSTVAAANFGYNHYRHRCFVVAYLPKTRIAQSNASIFKEVSKYANKAPGTKTPLLKNMTQEQRLFTKVDETRSIKLRSKRINAIGNTVVRDVAYAILQSIADLETQSVNAKQNKYKAKDVLGYMRQNGIVETVNYSLFEDSTFIDKMPPAGFMSVDGTVYISARDERLNPKNTAYPDMNSTLLSRDGNNCFSGKARLTRPGKLGGLVGDLMREFGFNKGGLNPVYCERLLGLPDNITNIFD